MAKNVYIHIPFCRNGKCNYCSFISFDKIELKEDYLCALKQQIMTEYKGEELETLYFGGGTPSVLDINEIKNLLSLFNIKKDAEITLEMNPEGVDKAYLQGLKDIGINRISIGVQIFDDTTLKQIGRKHTSKQVRQVVKLAHEFGFNNISLDFIYGLPNQKIISFENDIKEAINLGVQHISLYGLKIEKGCYFYKNKPDLLPDLDTQADMYLKAIEVLSKEGFEHYEISNFSMPGFSSKHNLNYWNNNTYYGFGLSASGYLNGIRYTNETNLGNYIKNPLKTISKENLTQEQILEEAIFLGFRKIAGINISQINKKFKIDFNKKYSKILEKYQQFIIPTAEGYALTTEGILLSNEILAEFISL